jgi:hypothetical protein
MSLFESKCLYSKNCLHFSSMVFHYCGNDRARKLNVLCHPLGRNSMLNSHLSSSQLTVGSSILLMRTTRFLTPAVLTNIACSRVWPPRSKPVSNSPLRAEITCNQNKTVSPKNKVFCHFLPETHNFTIIVQKFGI